MSGRGPRDRRKILEQTYGVTPALPAPSRPKRMEPRQYRPIARPVKPQPMPSTDGPRLRLVGIGPADAKMPPVSPAPPRREQPMLGTADPRWVLAVRCGEKLQGTILTPESREQLMKLGRLLGLSPFDTSLVIAIVQDQARRGHHPGECAAAGEAQLRMIPRPQTTSLVAVLKRLDGWQIAMILAALIATELLVLNWFF